MADPHFEFRQWLKAKLDAQGHGAKGALARHLGIKPDAITRMLNTDPLKEMRGVQAHELLAMRQYFGEADPEAIVFTPIPIMGFVGAGAEISPEFEQVPEEGLDDVELPFPLPDEMVAFIIRGDSMMPVYKPDTIIIVYREQRHELAAFNGREAAVRTAEGRRYLKTITTTGRGSSVILTSWNAEPIVDVKLEWIGEIFATMPPAAVRRVARRGGIQGQLSLPASTP